MKQKLIEHKLRKIEFDYDDTKPWTEADEKLLAAFIELHDYELQKSQEGSKLMQDYGERNKQVEAAREELNRMKEKFADVRERGDHLISDVALKKSNAVEQFYDAIEETNKAIQEYDKIMRAINIDDLNNEKTKYFEYQNNMECWDRFSAVNLTHSQNYEINSIDIVSFDNADEVFRSHIRLLREQANSKMDYINSAIGNYNRLMLETEMQYEIWKEFQKRIELIQKITGSNSGAAYFNQN